jgi:hypothetical protein
MPVLSKTSARCFAFRKSRAERQPLAPGPIAVYLSTMIIADFLFVPQDDLAGREPGLVPKHYLRAVPVPPRIFRGTNFDGKYS